MGVHLVMLKMRLDDPLDAVAVHGGGGEIFHTPNYLLLNEDLQTFISFAQRRNDMSIIEPSLISNKHTTSRQFRNTF